MRLLNDELNYNNSTNNSMSGNSTNNPISSNSTNNTNSNINQSEDYDIITFDNYSYQGTKKNLSFKIPKIVLLMHLKCSDKITKT